MSLIEKIFFHQLSFIMRILNPIFIKSIYFLLKNLTLVAPNVSLSICV